MGERRVRTPASISRLLFSKWFPQDVPLPERFNGVFQEKLQTQEPVFFLTHLVPFSNGICTKYFLVYVLFQTETTVCSVQNKSSKRSPVPKITARIHARRHACAEMAKDSRSLVYYRLTVVCSSLILTEKTPPPQGTAVQLRDSQATALSPRSSASTSPGPCGQSQRGQRAKVVEPTVHQQLFIKDKLKIGPSYQ